MSEPATPVVAASYGGLGAWSAAELDAAVLQSAGIRAVVSGDAHHPAPLFTGHQVMLMVAPSDQAEAVALLSESDTGREDRVVMP